jgi:hypothetical protein
MSQVIYGLFILINLFLAKGYESIHKNLKLKKIVFFVLWLFIVVFVSIRYDVGNDYSNYVGHFWYINNNGFITPDYIIFELLTHIFSFSKNGYIGVFSIYFIFTFSLVLHVLKKYNIVLWGLFVFFTFGIFFDSLDRIRQVAALAIFIYALEDIEKNHFFSFLMKIIFASLFHFSAFILLPFYFVSKLPINKLITSLWFFILIIGFFIGIWSNLIEYIYSYIPYYNTLYQDSINAEKIDELGTGLGFLGKVLFIYLNVLFAPVNNKYKVLLMVGLTFYIIGVGNLNIERVSDYFLAITLISFPFFVKYFKKSENKIIIVFPIIMFLLIFFIKNINQEYFKYQTIFSTEFQEQKLKDRTYE